MLHLPPPPRPEYDHGIIRLSDLEMLEIVLQAAQERADVLGITVRVVGPDSEWVVRPSYDKSNVIEDCGDWIMIDDPAPQDYKPLTPEEISRWKQFIGRSRRGGAS